MHLNFLKHPHAENPPEVAACLQEISAGKTTLRLSAKEKRPPHDHACRGLVYLTVYLIEISAWARLELTEAKIFAKNLIKMSAVWADLAWTQKSRLQHYCGQDLSVKSSGMALGTAYSPLKLHWLKMSCKAFSGAAIIEINVYYNFTPLFLGNAQAGRWWQLSYRCLHFKIFPEHYRGFLATSFHGLCAQFCCLPS